MPTNRTEQALARLADLTPRQIVAELDRFIVGQKDAKKAVAIALRNRWRRQRAPESIRDAFNLVRAGGTVVLVGAPGVVKGVDLTHLWNKEVRWVGTMAYAWDDWRGERRRTFDVTREILAGTTRPVEKLITHTFPLERYQDALRANLDRGRSGAIKTVLRTPA